MFAPGRLRTWLDASLDAERVRWPLWLPVALGAGVAFYFALASEPGIWTVLIAVGVALIALGLIPVIGSAAVRLSLALVVATATGFAVAKLRELSVAAPVLAERAGPFSLRGRVEYAQIHGKGIRVVLSHIESKRFDTESTPAELRISFRTGAEDLRPGDVIRATAVLMPPPGPSAPDDYDFGRTAFFERLGGVGYAYGRPDVISPASDALPSIPLAEGISRLRFRMTERIHEVLPGSTGSIASALIAGDRGGISDTDEQALRDAGLAHVLAIAGLHMALVGLGLFWLVRAILAAIPSLALRYPVKKWAAGAALAGAGFYLVISGAGTPSVRAFTMLAMMLFAIMVDRPALSMRSVALAATIILLSRPESLIQPGFQMSFSAVVGLIAVAEWEQARAASRDFVSRPRFAGIRRYLRGIATTSLVGSLATMPYAIFHFDRATHYAVLGNLLAMPIMGFVVMPAAAVSVTLMPLGLDAWPLRVMGFGISAMLAVGRRVSTLPGAVSVVSAWPVSALALMTIGGLWCAIWRRNWRWLGLAPIAAGIGLVLTAQPPDVLIARDARTVAVRVREGSLAFVGRAADLYSANQWLKRDGDERTADEAEAAHADGTFCDAYGCRARLTNGQSLAVVLRPDALDEDCARASILVTDLVLSQPCPGPSLVLDRRRIEDAGGYAVWLSPLKVRSVQEERGDRPWSAQPLPSYDDQ